MAPPSLKKAGKMLKEIKLDSKSAKGCCIKFLTHTLLFLVVVAYAVGGAYFIIWLESDAEQERIKLKKDAGVKITNAKSYIIASSWYQSTAVKTLEEFKNEMIIPLNMFRMQLIQTFKEAKYDGNPNEWNYDWTFSKSLLFTVTTISAIGYGHITPKTFNGKMFCVLYGMIGVPLLLIFLANIGDFLAKSLKFIYSRVACRWCRLRRHVSDSKSNKKLTRKNIWKESIGNEEFMPTNEVEVPITLNLVLLFVYCLLGGALFSYWENWTISESFYFTFITLTTIGFGDYVPGNSFKVGDDNQALISSLKMIATITYCIFGMALISMAINLMQVQIITKLQWVVQELGISQQSRNVSYKYHQIKNDPADIQETPPDKDGNQRALLNIEDETDQNMKNKRKKNTL